MGRQKGTPKKSKTSDIGEIWSAHNYIPVIKKKARRSQSMQKTVSYKVPHSTDKNKSLYFGKILIGLSHNVLPEGIDNCRIYLKNIAEDHAIIMEFGTVTVVVRSIIDTDFFMEILATKYFCIDFEKNCEEIYAKIYFLTLPLPKFHSKGAKCIKTLCQIFFKIQTKTSEGMFKNLSGNSEITDLYNNILCTRDKELDTRPDINVQQKCLKPMLRPYQQKAVKWMLSREQMTPDQNENLHPLYIAIQLESGVELFYDRFTGYMTNIKPMIENSSMGGILADEMGLGKTIEVLATILLHPKDSGKYDGLEQSGLFPVIDKRKRKRKVENDMTESSDKYIMLREKSKKSRVIVTDCVKSSSHKKTAMRIALELWYENTLASTSTITTKPAKSLDEPLIQCVCGSLNDSDLVECFSCGKYQHRTCFGYHRSMGKYLCPQCWMDEPLLEVDATLIVTPSTLRTQWCKEITKHIKGNLKVLNYEGHNVSQIYPTVLSRYDIVITTYAVLRSELVLTETTQTFNLRRERKYSPPGSPLVRIKWWRLCLDEAQSVESPTTKVSEMAQKIHAHFRWAVTGTPISKNISDLYSLINYLDIAPYNDFTTWKNVLYDPYVSGNKQPLLDFLSSVLWRTSKNNVLKQINIPEQTFVEHKLEFSAVEKFFYKKEHESIRKDFLSKVLKYDSSILLEKLDRNILKTVMAPLIALRHACSYPSTTRGRYLATKKKLTSMKDFLDALILRNINDSEDCLRLIVSSLNGLAGIKLLMKCTEDAINYYREVLMLASRFSQDHKVDGETKLSVDKLQLIHTTYNLAEVIETNPPQHPTLRDEFLRRDCSNIEERYMAKFINQAAAAYEGFKSIYDQIEMQRTQFMLKSGQWYSDGLDWLYIRDYFQELLDKITTACDSSNIKCDYLRNVNERQLLKIIFEWEDEIHLLRNDVIAAILELFTIDQLVNNGKFTLQDHLVQKAMDCHLRPDNNSNKKSEHCPVCDTNEKLKMYEMKLFSTKKRTKLFEDMSLLGSWKPTKEELILKCLHNTLKLKHAGSEIIKDAETHLSIIDHLKKEFKEIRKFWTFLDQLVCAHDELDMCKLRFQLKEASNPEYLQKISRIVKHLSYNTESKMNNINLISVHEIDYHSSLLQSELEANKYKLENLLGTQSYLETLRKQQYEGHSPDPCPICKNSLEQHWSILACGHSYCLECIQHLIGKTITGGFIQCSICRNKHKCEDISYIKAGESVTDDDCNKIKGNFSTKIEAVIKLLVKLKGENENVKVLMFSTWETVLRSLKKALDENTILCEITWNGKLEEKIENFKDPSKKITVLLLPIQLGSKGLNLIEATQVILVEPFLNPADELQAIGRVHRIGQTKATVVHKFMIQNTIEENIYQAISVNAENWDKNRVTLKSLIDLFNVVEPEMGRTDEALESSDSRFQDDDVEELETELPDSNSDINLFNDHRDVTSSSDEGNKHIEPMRLEDSAGTSEEET